MKEYLTYMNTPIPQIIEAWDDEGLRRIPICESGEELVPLGLNPDRMIVSPQYYIQKIDGALAESYARRTVCKMLAAAAKSLPEGYRLVIYDCWRPLKLQQAMFDNRAMDIRADHPSMPEGEIFKRTRKYVAPPSRDAGRPTPHNTGGAVDLTIADENGLALDMGCGFDDPTGKACTVYYEKLLNSGEKLSPADVQAAKNRRLLYHVMRNAGFTNYIDEWWHYDYGDQNWAWCTGSAEAVYGKTTPSFPWYKDIE